MRADNSIVHLSVSLSSSLFFFSHTSLSKHLQILQLAAALHDAALAYCIEYPGPSSLSSFFFLFFAILYLFVTCFFLFSRAGEEAGGSKGGRVRALTLSLSLSLHSCKGGEAEVGRGGTRASTDFAGHLSTLLVLGEKKLSRVPRTHGAPALSCPTLSSL